jgi:hypothetical protein
MIRECDPLPHVVEQGGAKPEYVIVLVDPSPNRGKDTHNLTVL